MAVFLNRNYGGFTSSSTVAVTLPDSTEQALIAQGLATASIATTVSSVIGGPDTFINQTGNIYPIQQAGQSTPTVPQGNSILTNIALGSLALTSYETNGVAPAVAGTYYYTEIFVPFWNTWKGIGVLNGTTVGTDNHLVILYGANGNLIANSAVAGAVTANASIMQNFAFLVPATIAPGRYFIGMMSNGTPTDTVRHILSANGSNVITGSQTGTFGTIPATITTVSTTFTSAQGPIMQLYTT